MQNPYDNAEGPHNSNVIQNCILCGNKVRLFFQMPGKRYYQCLKCRGVFLDPLCRIPRKHEKLRYEEHINDVKNRGYRNFVSPLVSKISEKFDKNHCGLDFGAGTGPVASELLREKGYSPELYDPFFYKNPKALLKNYDFIICCEVIEHFRNPAKEFGLLRSLLKPAGILFCQTELYCEKTDFKSWYYKNDPTHIFFYHLNTLRFIKRLFDFSDMENEGRLILFKV